MQAKQLPAFALVAFYAATSLAQEIESPALEVVISVAEQRLVVLRDGMWIGKYRVSTSKFGLGDNYGSYKTPVGLLRVCEKIGGELPIGSVIRHRHATGEILPVNAPGRDPIVTRVLWLEGLEERNAHAKSRGIYIHGTVEEAKLGEPVSYGCIRMRSREVADLYEHVPIGTLVTIQHEKLQRYRRWTAPEPVIIAAKTPPKQPRIAALKIPHRPLSGTALVASAPPPHPPEKRAHEPFATPAVESSSDFPATLSGVTFAQAAEKKAANPLDVVDDPSDRVANPFKGSILFADLPGQRSGRRMISETRFALEPVREELKVSSPSPKSDTAPVPRVTFRTGLSPSTSAAGRIP